MPFKAKGPAVMTDWANAATSPPPSANGGICPGLELRLLALSFLVTQCVTSPMYKTLQKGGYLRKPR